jgi:hypothetical protein
MFTSAIDFFRSQTLINKKNVFFEYRNNSIDLKNFSLNLIPDARDLVDGAEVNFSFCFLVINLVAFTDFQTRHGFRKIFCSAQSFFF